MITKQQVKFALDFGDKRGTVLPHEDAVMLAQVIAERLQPTYYDDPFDPHMWVVIAIQTAFDLGVAAGKVVK